MFIVVSIVIFGIFVSLSYTLFGKQVLSNDLENIFLDATGQVNELFDKTIPIDEDLFTFNENTRTITGYSNDGPKDLVIPRSINGVTVRKIGPSAFTNKGLTSVKFPDTVNEIENSKINYKGAFTGNKLGNFTVPSSLKVLGDFSFTNAGITNLTLEDGVESIKSHSFYLNNLKELDIPKSVFYIGGYSFTSKGLTKVTFNGSLDVIGGFAFNNNNIKEFKLHKDTKILGNQILKGNNNLENFSIPKELKNYISEKDKGPIVKDSKYNSETKSFYDFVYFSEDIVNYY